jgi:ketosteroid isomerase-like protein
MRGGYEAMTRGDFEAVLALMDPEVEVHDRPEVPDAGSYHGHEGVLAALRQSFDTFDEFRIVPEQFIDAGDRVVVIIRMMGRGRASGVGVEDRIAHLWRIRDGRAIHLQVYSDPGAALAAVGLGAEGSAQAT